MFTCEVKETITDQFFNKYDFYVQTFKIFMKDKICHISVNNRTIYIIVVHMILELQRYANFCKHQPKTFADIMSILCQFTLGRNISCFRINILAN